MDSIIKKTKKKVSARYRTLYLTDELSDALNEIAKENDTSFNNVVISIVEDYVKHREKNKLKEKEK